MKETTTNQTLETVMEFQDVNNDGNIINIIDGIVDSTEKHIADCVSNVINGIPDILLSDISKALKKQTSIKVRAQDYFYGYIYSCPCCDHFLTTVKEHTTNYCSECGQALDWSET